jgi:hypothetical protein
MIIVLNISPDHEKKVDGIMKEIRQAYPDEIVKSKAISDRIGRTVKPFDTKDCYNKMQFGDNKGKPFCKVYNLATCKCR